MIPGAAPVESEMTLDDEVSIFIPWRNQMIFSNIC